MKIFIPSYDRPWTSTTPQLLAAEGVDFYLILRNREQVKLYWENPFYRSLPRNRIALCDGDLGQKREAVRNLVDYGQWVIQMDDNVKGFWACDPDFYAAHTELPWPDGHRINARKLYGDVLSVPVSFRQFYKQIVTDSIRTAEERGANIVGFSPHENPLFRTKKFYDVGYIQNKVVCMRKTKLWWDQSNGFPAMEEFALAAAHHLEYGRVLINKWGTYDAGHYQPGGLGPYDQRIPAKRAACGDLMKRYPGLFRHPWKLGDGSSKILDAELQFAVRDLKQVEKWRASMNGTDPVFMDMSALPAFLSSPPDATLPIR